MLEHGRSVVRQVLIEADRVRGLAGLPFGSAERKNIRTETENEPRPRGKPL